MQPGTSFQFTDLFQKLEASVLGYANIYPIRGLILGGRY